MQPTPQVAALQGAPPQVAIGAVESSTATPASVPAAKLYDISGPMRAAVSKNSCAEEEWRPNALGLSRAIIKLIWGTMAFVSLVLIATLLSTLLGPPPSHSPAVSSLPADSAGVGAPVDSTSANIALIPAGPPFATVDATMDDRRTDLTDAQRQIYWEQVVGTQVSWRGQIDNVELGGGGRLNLRCNSNSILTDTRVELDGSQLDWLPRLQKGQAVTVQAILRGHGLFGYRLGQGRIVG